MTQSVTKRLPLILLGFVVLALVVYFPATKAGFIWDDDAYLTENPLLRDAGGLWRIWTTTETPQYYPLVFTTLWVEYQLWGLSPAGYHIVNILLHAINAALIGLILSTLRVRGAWWVALLFAVHPVHVESVAWVTERKNVLSGLFYLLSFQTYLRYELSARRGLYITALVFFFLALLSKTVAASLPLALLLALYWMKKKLGIADGLRMLPFFGLSVAMGLVTVFLEEGMIEVVKAEFQFSWYERALIASKALLFYPFKLIVPYPLIFNYPRWEIESAGPWALVVVPLLIGLSVYLWRMKLRGLVFAIAFFVITIAPALGIFNVYPFRYSFVADHFQYLASIGILILIVQAARGKWIWVAGPPVLVLLALLTWNQTGIYKDVETLWQHTIAKNPRSWLAHNNMALIQLDRGETLLAMESFNKAINSRPDSVESYTGRGMVRRTLQDYDGALLDFESAVKLDPSYPQLYLQRGELYAKLGRYDEAVRDFDIFLESNPGYMDGYRSRALAHVGARRYELALADLGRAIEMGANEEAYNDRGVVYMQLKRYEEAIADFTTAIGKTAEPGRFLHNRGMARAASGRFREALDDYAAALEEEPDALNSHIARGKLYIEAFRDRRAACRDYHRACQLGDCRYHERDCSNR
jgi:tetratricopeptide (TPR) repeat protein